MTELDDNVMASSAQKILAAATRLFAHDNFDSVSIKDIATVSGVNSALISYYFGGKKKLYQEVLYKETESFLALQNKVRELNATPLEKLHHYVDAIADLQEECPYQLHLVFRDLLSPEPMFESLVKERLYKVHRFMAELVDEAMDQGLISKQTKSTHVAFTLEGMILFFFLMRSSVQILGNFDKGHEVEYLYQSLDSYLKTLAVK